jgi:hypothetical protein
VRPGSKEAARVKEALVAQGAWSQYLEVGIGPDAEIFTKAPATSAVGLGADEQQPKHVVMDLLFRVVGVHLGEGALVSFLATKLVEHVVVRDPISHAPGSSGSRRPRLRRTEERGLRGVLAQLHAMQAEPTRENGDQAPELAAEPMLRKLGRGHVRTTGSRGSRRS